MLESYNFTFLSSVNKLLFFLFVSEFQEFEKNFEEYSDIIIRAFLTLIILKLLFFKDCFEILWNNVTFIYSKDSQKRSRICVYQNFFHKNKETKDFRKNYSSYFELSHCMFRCVESLRSFPGFFWLKLTFLVRVAIRKLLQASNQLRNRNLNLFFTNR